MKHRAIVFSGLVMLVIYFAGCATGPSSRIKQDPEVFASFPEEVQDNIRAGEIDIGYTKEMVEMALGRPDRVVTRTSGDREERVWIYTRSLRAVGLSVGTGFVSGSSGRATGVGAGVGTGRGGSVEEAMRVVFHEGEVSSIEKSE